MLPPRSDRALGWGAFVAQVGVRDKSLLPGTPTRGAIFRSATHCHNGTMSMDGVAVVLAPGAFRTDSAKTAHGLVRGSERFEVVAVLDADAAGHDAGELLDGH